MEALDPREGRWISKAPLQHARSCFALAAINESCFLACGGHVGLSAADTTYGPTAICELYDSRKDSWLFTARLDVAAVSPASAVIGGQILVIGGYDGMSTLRRCQALSLQIASASEDAVFGSEDLLGVARSGPVAVPFL